MNPGIRYAIGFTALVSIPAWSTAAPTSSYTAIPPFLEVNTPKPNVLIVLDNSNSMDENVSGEAVGSRDPTSRSEIARNALTSMVTEFGDQLRIGLMAYRQTGVQSRHVHNAFYYHSHDPLTFDPNGSFTPRDASSNTLSSNINGHTIYFDQALPYYSGTNDGNMLCYSTNFQPRVDPNPPVADINQNITQDNPYTCCTGKTGTLDISPDGVNNDAAAIAEFTGCLANTFSFALTDSDVAAGFWQIGAHMGWNHVGDACLSTDTPDGGFLHVPIADTTNAQVASLNAVLDTWNGDCTTDTPLRNAGFTPLATTLGTARDYFLGNLSSATNGGPQASPLQYECQQNFVILVTDGLPTEDVDGDGDFIDDTVEQAGALRNITVTLGTETVDCDVRTFVLGFALPPGAQGALDPIAVAGGTDIDTNGDGNGEAYYAGDETELLAQLRRLFLEMLNRNSSGTSAAINLGSFSGEGMAVRATFRPQMTDGTDSVNWTGHLNSLFIDDAGNLRDDGNTNLTLDAPATDPYIDMCYNASTSVVRVKLSTTESARPSHSDILDCTVGNFPLTQEDLHYLWDAGEWLAGLTDANITSGNRGYTTTSSARYIMTNIDADGDGVVDSGDYTPFLPASFTDSNAGLLQAADLTEATAIVNQIRGADQAGMRSRQITENGTVKTWRLGDIIYSSPTMVGRPSEAFDLLYRDDSYGEFFDAYRNRRQVIYLGANDGMLHAFNGGYFNTSNSSFSNGPPNKAAYALGSELWAFIPYNALAHLKYLTGPSYGNTSGDHIYSVDLQPRVFDAKIFGANGVSGQTGVNHPQGWGTVLVAGMRFGGGEITVDADLTAATTDNRTLRSSYFIFDITDPEAPPELLMEFTHPDLGYTTSMPAPIKVGSDWYLMIGSGPHPADATALGAASSDQAGRLFLINLKTMALESSFGTNGVLALTRAEDANSFFSDLIAVDYNLDYSADGVYFGTVSGAAGSWSGSLQRIPIVSDETTTPWTYSGVGSWTPKLLYNTGKPITMMPTFALDASDNRWVYVGSGRFLVRADVADTTVQRFHGIKEPRNTSGDFQWTSSTATATSLLNVTNSLVYENTEVLTGVTATISAGSPCTTGTVDTFSEIECYLRQYSYGNDYQDGWYRDFTTRQRSISSSTALGGTLTYTGYTPSDVICEAEGESDLFALYFGTGTAFREPIIGLTATQDAQGNHAIETVIDLGRGAAVTPSIHSGSGYQDNVQGKTVKAVVQTSTGSIHTIVETNPQSVRPGEMNWREH